jgi:hypothetical protein
VRDATDVTTIEKHTIPCDELFILNAWDEHGNPVEHQIRPVPPATQADTPDEPDAPGAPAEDDVLLIDQDPSWVATIIKVDHRGNHVAIPYSAFPRLFDDDTGNLVAYRLDATRAPRGRPLPGAAIPGLERGTVLMFGVAPDAAGEPR